MGRRVINGTPGIGVSQYYIESPQFATSHICIRPVSDLNSFDMNIIVPKRSAFDLYYM